LSRRTYQGQHQFQAEIALNDLKTKNKIRVRALHGQANNDEALDLAVLSSLCRRALRGQQLPILRRVLCHSLLAICHDVDAQMQIRGAEAMLLVIGDEMDVSIHKGTPEFKSAWLESMEVINNLERLDEVCDNGGETELNIEWWMIDAHESKKRREEPV